MIGFNTISTPLTIQQVLSQGFVAEDVPIELIETATGQKTILDHSGIDTQDVSNSATCSYFGLGMTYLKGLFETRVRYELATAVRTILFPNKSGTIALTSDIKQTRVANFTLDGTSAADLNVFTLSFSEMPSVNYNVVITAKDVAGALLLKDGYYITAQTTTSCVINFVTAYLITDVFTMSFFIIKLD